MPNLYSRILKPQSVPASAPLWLALVNGNGSGGALVFIFNAHGGSLLIPKSGNRSPIPTCRCNIKCLIIICRFVYLCAFWRWGELGKCSDSSTIAMLHCWELWQIFHCRHQLPHAKTADGEREIYGPITSS